MARSIDRRTAALTRMHTETATPKAPTATMIKRYNDLMSVNERGLTPSALERHKRAWKTLAEQCAKRGLTLTDLA